MTTEHQPEEAIEEVDISPALIENGRNTGVLDIYASTQAFEHVQRVAKVFAVSKLVPELYRGNIADCIIAVQMSNRLGIDPFLFMQNTYIIRGKPAIEGKLAIALINSRGGFKHKLKFDYDGTGDHLACICWTIDAHGDRLEEKMTIADAKAHGWFSKSDSPWLKMPRQMLAYRTAVFFGRKYCPETLLGLQTRDEVIDVSEEQETTASLNQRIKQV